MSFLRFWDFSKIEAIHRRPWSGAEDANPPESGQEGDEKEEKEDEEEEKERCESVAIRSTWLTKIERNYIYCSFWIITL